MGRETSEFLTATKTGDFEILGTSTSTLCTRKGKQTRDLDEMIEVGEEIQGTELLHFLTTTVLLIGNLAKYRTNDREDYGSSGTHGS